MRSLELLSSAARKHKVSRRVGRVRALETNVVLVDGLSDIASIGHQVIFDGIDNLRGEIVGVGRDFVRVMTDGSMAGLRLDQRVVHIGEFLVWPDESWVGRTIDCNGEPLDGLPLIQGPRPTELKNSPPQATMRRCLGHRISTGHAVFDTVLPIVRGQRVGLFSGSGVGKSSLMAAFAQEFEADIVVIGLVGERGREVNNFVNRVLGKKGMKRSVVVAATSDMSAQARRRAAFTAMAVAEYFRDQGFHVLLMIDSITRLAEAHREVATSAGEPISVRGHPSSMVNLLAGFSERAGPGADGQGDITAIFTVLVSGSDMEEPVADTLRGLLDGHFVLSREIAERGRFPAVDVLQSVSRSLPEAASEDENRAISLTRRILGVFEESEIMVRSGLYQPGSNPDLDAAIELQPLLDAFFSKRTASIQESFEMLSDCLQVFDKT